MPSESRSYLTHEIAFKKKTRASEIFLFDMLPFFNSLGFLEQDIVVSEFRSQTKLSVYTPNDSQAIRAKQKFKKLPRGVILQIKKLDRNDWFDKWKTRFKTFKAGKLFQIIPAWEKAEVLNKKRSNIPIFIDPGASFGSGHHETTRLVLEQMEAFKGRFESFLDIGCGTGILSLAAYYLGAKRIDALDHDLESIRDAEKNFKLNNIQTIQVSTRDIGKGNLRKTYDLVAANLLTTTLIACQNQIARTVKNGKCLIVSGILRKNLPSFLKSFHPEGVKLQKIQKGRSWACLVYQKSNT